MKVNQIIHGQCAEVMAELPEESVDLVVTSPPYDDLRTYKGYQFDYQAVIAGLHRVVKKGGVVCWVVSDKIKNGNRSLTSFRQALAFQDAGFSCHDLIIWVKASTPFLRQGAYTQAHELVLVMAKGKPKTFTATTKPCKKPHFSGVRGRNADGSYIKVLNSACSKAGEPIPLSNVWEIANAAGGKGGNLYPRAFEHPATFPEELAARCITSWSAPGDLVLDPMAGSGTTCMAASVLCRNWLGIEISEDYAALARERMGTTLL